MPSAGFIDLIITGGEGIPLLQRRIATYEVRLQDHTEPLQQIAQDVLREVDDNFGNQGGRYGPWSPLAPSTMASRRFPSMPILQQTGEMRSSFKVLESSPNSITVGSRNWKATIHQGGTRDGRIPARRMIGLSWDMREKMVQRFSEWVKKVLAEG